MVIFHSYVSLPDGICLFVGFVGCQSNTGTQRPTEPWNAGSAASKETFDGIDSQRGEKNVARRAKKNDQQVGLDGQVG